MITPSFQQADFIEETIRSVLLQNYPNLQFIIMDGGSTDHTKTVLEKYAPWLDHWESASDRGQSHAINKGLDRADGEWFNWINSDDYFLPEAFVALVNGIKDSNTVVVAGVTQNIRHHECFSTYQAHIPPHHADALFNLGVNQPGSLMRMSAIRESGAVDEALNLVMDLHLWLRLLIRHSPAGFSTVPAEIAAYRYHENSKTESGDDVFAVEEFAVLFDLMAEFKPPSSAALQTLRQRCNVHSVPFAAVAQIDLDPSACYRAWLQRLIVRDSLLFRTMRCLAPSFDATMQWFRPAVREIVAQHHESLNESPHHLESRALLHALERSARFDLATAWRIIRLAPSVASLRALVRLLIRSRP